MRSRSRLHIQSIHSFTFNGFKRCYSSSVELLPRLFSTSSRQYDSRIVVRVPPMAGSIAGTQNQFNKQVDDFIELDGELATIETDKGDVSVNAPQSGVIKQLLVREGELSLSTKKLWRLKLANKLQHNLTRAKSQLRGSRISLNQSKSLQAQCKRLLE